MKNYRQNTVERFFLLKSRTKRFSNRFPKNKVQLRFTLSNIYSIILYYKFIIKILHLDNLYQFYFILLLTTKHYDHCKETLKTCLDIY